MLEPRRAELLEMLSGRFPDRAPSAVMDEVLGRLAIADSSRTLVGIELDGPIRAATRAFLADGTIDPGNAERLRRSALLRPLLAGHR